MVVSVRLIPVAKAALIRQHLDDGVPLTRLAAAAGLPGRTLRRWAASYRTDPTASALQRQERSDLPAPATPTSAPPWPRSTRGCGPSRATWTRPTATSSSWSTGVPRPVPTSSVRPTTPCSTFRSWTSSSSRPGRGSLSSWDDYSAQLVADAAASSALQVAHATAVEGYLPVPGATMVRAGRSQPWLVVAAGVDRVALADLAGQVVHVPRRTVLPDPLDPGALPVGALDQA